MEDPELLLTHGDWSARVAPLGASLRGVWYRGEAVATGYSGAAHKVGGEGDVLIPFPGRVAGGTYDFGGQTHRLAINDKGGPNAIHGFVRDDLWTLVGESAGAATFTLDFAGAPGYPFPLQASITYSLDDDGLTCSFSVTNTGDAPAPVGVGFHPYFTVGSENVEGDTLTLPFDKVLEFENLIPSGALLDVADAGLDFRAGRTIGGTVIDNCFTAPVRDADGLARVSLSGNGRRTIVWMDGSCDWCVLFTGDTLPASHNRKYLAIEAMTCGSDAFHHHDWGLWLLAPGETRSGAWGVSAEVL